MNRRLRAWEISVDIGPTQSYSAAQFFVGNGIPRLRDTYWDHVTIRGSSNGLADRAQHLHLDLRNYKTLIRGLASQG